MALGVVVCAVGATVLTSHTKACAAAGLPVLADGGAFAAGTRFFIDPNSAAAAWDARNPRSPLEPAIEHRIAQVPSAIWFTDYDPGQIAGRVAGITQRAAANGTVPILVLYDIPEVDCTSSSGAPSIAAYESWASAFASGLGGHRVIVIVEPDGLAGQTCLNAQQAAACDGAIAFAGSAVRKADPDARVYFDAGDSAWNSASVQAARLREADVAGSADGIFSNVSNFRVTSDEVAYDKRVLDALGDSSLHIVVDTSRNGNGPGSTWCDPGGRALGQLPTANTGDPLVDAYLWVKDPGQADGCAASAGAFDPQIAYDLIADGPGGAGAYATKTPSTARGTVRASGKATQGADSSGSAALPQSEVPAVTTAAGPHPGCS